MKRALAMLTIAWLGLSASASAQVFKCEDAQGRVQFQQAPCTGAGGLHSARSERQPDAQPGALRARRELVKLQQRNAIMEGIRKGLPVIGMDMTELGQAIGAPTRINTGNYQGTHRDQYIYERPAGTWYIYPRNGLVDSIQFTQAINLLNDRPRCPTEFELRDARVSAGSITASEQALERWKELQRQAQACKQ